jgi:diguanylate cyclase (GGDEF)-like protein
MSQALTSRPLLTSADQRRVMARLLAGVGFFACVVALARLLLPHPASAHDGTVAATIVGALACSVVMLVLPPRAAPDRVIEALLLIATGLISVGVASAGAPGTGVELYYVWATPYAWFFFGPRRAAVQTVAAAVGYGVALVVQAASGPGTAPPAGELLGRWLLLLGTVVVVGALVRRLARWMGEHDARFRRAFEDSPSAMAIRSTSGRYVDVNDTWCALHGRSREEFLGGDADPGETPRAGPSAERRLLRPDGTEVWTSGHTSVVADQQGEELYLFCQLEDVSERRRAELELARRLRQQEAVARVGQIALGASDIDALMAEVARVIASTLEVRFATVFELSDDGTLLMPISAVGWDDAIPMPVTDRHQSGHTALTGTPLVVEDFDAQHRFERSARLAQHAVVSGLTVAIGGRHRSFGVLAAHSTERRHFSTDDVTFVRALANVLSSVLERRRSDQASWQAARRDPLTGLANRTLLAEYLDGLDAGTGRAAFVLDVDAFKFVNDSLGHAAGDRLLELVADRLRSHARHGDLLSRPGGDEFVLIAEGVRTDEAALALGHRLADGCSGRFDLDGEEVEVSVTVGVCRVEAPSGAAEAMRDADLALYEAKQERRGSVKLFASAMRETANRRLTLERHLRRALERDELHVVYQPVVDVVRGRIAGMEALLRWRSEALGDVSPAEFVPIAERTGLILPIGRFVLARAIEQLAIWRDAGHNLVVSVNVSPSQLADEQLPDLLEELLAVYRVPGEVLLLELTETALMRDTGTQPREVLDRLRRTGAGLVLDDFGTGYSSLSRLSSLELAAVKIDRTFIASMATDPASRAVVSAVLQMAGPLRCVVVAEGVETEHQRDLLAELGCPRAQGYLFGAPQPAEAAGRLLAAGVAPHVLAA